MFRSGDMICSRYAQKGIMLPIHESHHFYSSKKARIIPPDSYFDYNDIKIVMERTGVCFDSAMFLLETQNGNIYNAVATYQHALDFGNDFFDAQ